MGQDNQHTSHGLSRVSIFSLYFDYVYLVIKYSLVTALHLASPVDVTKNCLKKK